MKLILSRKGFDSSAGGTPSPIFPDGRMISLPIPDKTSIVTYSDISSDHGSLGSLAAQLTDGRIPPYYRAHIDPDLIHESLPRLPGWRPIFGQTGPAQSHLCNNGVGPGDLFLFFGLFRRVKEQNGAYSWATEVRSRHVIWGWMQVADVVPVSSISSQDYQWAKYHPHFHRDSGPNNVIYLAHNQLEADHRANVNLPGAGVFPWFSSSRQLTAPLAANTTAWKLPGCFYPGNNKTPLTYHRNLQRWKKRDGQTELKAATRGQEFVLNCDEYPEAIKWAYGLIQDKNHKSQKSVP